MLIKLRNDGNYPKKIKILKNWRKYKECEKEYKECEKSSYST